MLTVPMQRIFCLNPFAVDLRSSFSLKRRDDIFCCLALIQRLGCYQQVVTIDIKVIMKFNHEYQIYAWRYV